MKKRPDGFLSSEIIDQDSEQFDYIRELHHYLWRFVRVHTPSANGKLDDYVDKALELAEKGINSPTPMNIEKELKKIREEFDKEFAYSGDGIYFVEDIHSQADTQDIKDFYETRIHRLLEEQNKEMVSEICDGLAHMPIHGDMDLMAEEIKGLRKEIYKKYILEVDTHL